MVYLAQLSVAFYINLVPPVEPSNRQCYKMSPITADFAVLQVVAKTILAYTANSIPAQLSISEYCLLHPSSTSGRTQCYKMSREILQCSALQILAAAIARTYRLSQTNSLLWRNGLECTRNSHFHQMLTLSSSVLPSLPGSYDKSQTWVVGRTFVFSTLEIHIFNCFSETLFKIYNICFYVYHHE